MSISHPVNSVTSNYFSFMHTAIISTSLLRYLQDTSQWLE